MLSTHPKKTEVIIHASAHPVHALMRVNQSLLLGKFTQCSNCSKPFKLIPRKKLSSVYSQQKLLSLLSSMRNNSLWSKVRQFIECKTQRKVYTFRINVFEFCLKGLLKCEKIINCKIIANNKHSHCKFISFQTIICFYKICKKHCLLLLDNNNYALLFKLHQLLI